MTLTIDLPSELEERLVREAPKHGLSASEYACRLIEQRLCSQQEKTKSLWETLAADEWERAFDEYLASHDATNPPLPPEAFERARFSRFYGAGG